MSLCNKVTKIMRNEGKYLIPNYTDIYNKIIPKMLKPFKNIKIDKVVAIESAGLFYGAILAYKLKVPFIQLLKGRRVHTEGKAISKDFIDYSQKQKSIEILEGSIKSGENILLVDDWFASGNTGKAVIELVEQLGGKVAGISVVFNELSKDDETFFSKYNFNFIARLEK